MKIVQLHCTIFILNWYEPKNYKYCDSPFYFNTIQKKNLTKNKNKKNPEKFPRLLLIISCRLKNYSTVTDFAKFLG